VEGKEKEAARPSRPIFWYWDWAREKKKRKGKEKEEKKVLAFSSLFTRLEPYSSVVTRRKTYGKKGHKKRGKKGNGGKKERKGKKKRKEGLAAIFWHPGMSRDARRGVLPLGRSATHDPRIERGRKKERERPYYHSSLSHDRPCQAVITHFDTAEGTRGKAGKKGRASSPPSTLNPIQALSYLGLKPDGIAASAKKEKERGENGKEEKKGEEKLGGSFELGAFWLPYRAYVVSNFGERRKKEGRKKKERLPSCGSRTGPNASPMVAGKEGKKKECGFLTFKYQKEEERKKSISPYALS